MHGWFGATVIGTVRADATVFCGREYFAQWVQELTNSRIVPSSTRPP
jgi:hypothetical protein